MEDASGRIEAVESISEGARILEEVDTAHTRLGCVLMPRLEPRGQWKSKRHPRRRVVPGIAVPGTILQRE